MLTMVDNNVGTGGMGQVGMDLHHMDYICIFTMNDVTVLAPGNL